MRNIPTPGIIPYNPYESRQGPLCIIRISKFMQDMQKKAASSISMPKK